MFSQVSVHPQGGPPVPGSFPGLSSQVLSGEVVPQSQVLCLVPVPFFGYPSPNQGGTLVPAGGGGTLAGTEVPPPTGTGIPHRLGMGYPPPPPRDSTEE